MKKEGSERELDEISNEVNNEIVSDDTISNDTTNDDIINKDTTNDDVIKNDTLDNNTVDDDTLDNNTVDNNTVDNDAKCKRMKYNEKEEEPSNLESKFTCPIDKSKNIFESGNKKNIFDSPGSNKIKRESNFLQSKIVQKKESKLTEENKPAADFSINCKLYYLEEENKEWIDVGPGEILIKEEYFYFIRDVLKTVVLSFPFKKPTELKIVNKEGVDEDSLNKMNEKKGEPEVKIVNGTDRLNKMNEKEEYKKFPVFKKEDNSIIFNAKSKKSLENSAFKIIERTYKATFETEKGLKSILEKLKL